MTTQINVYVGGNDLPDKARKQQEANRWRLTERERKADQAARTYGNLGVRPEGAGVRFDKDWNPIGWHYRSGYRPDELAASRKPESTIAFARVLSENLSPIKQRITVANADGSASTYVEYDKLSSQASDRLYRRLGFGNTLSEDPTQFTGEVIQFTQPNGPPYAWRLNSTSPGVDVGEIEMRAWQYIYPSTGSISPNIDEVSLSMPVGRDASVYVLRVEQHVNYKVVQLKDALIGVFDPGQGLAIFVDRGPTETNIISQSEYSVAYYAFYVSPTVVKQITCPEQLKQKLSILDPLLSVNNQTRQETYLLDGGVDNAGAVPFTVTVPTGISTRAPRIDRGMMYGLTSYGLGQYHSVARPGYFVTPGIYALLEKYQYEPTYNADNEVFSYLRSQYLYDAPVPSKFLSPCVIEGGCSTENAPYSLTFYRTYSLPDTNNTSDIVPTQSYSKATKSYTLSQPPYYSGYTFFWDWGQPGYCRQQLLALGFTEADLTP